MREAGASAAARSQAEPGTSGGAWERVAKLFCHFQSDKKLCDRKMDTIALGHDEAD